MGSLPHNHPANLLCGFTAGVLSLYSLFQGWGEIPVVFASLFLLAICVTDTLHAKIPNLLTLLLVCCGFAYHAWLSGSAGLFYAGQGLMAGFALLLVPYLFSGMGAGDVKALAALGSLMGPSLIFQVFLYMAFAGGVMAIMHYLCQRNLISKALDLLSTLRALMYSRDWTLLKPVAQKESIRFPYAAAIAFGFFAQNCWGNLV